MFEILMHLVYATPFAFVGVVMYVVFAFVLKKLFPGKEKSYVEYMRGAIVTLGMMYPIALRSSYIADISSVKFILIAALSATAWAFIAMPMMSVWYRKLSLMKQIAVAALIVAAGIAATGVIILIAR